MRRGCPLRRSTEDSDERSVKHTSAVASTLTLKGFVEGHPVSMLVDTGSSVTLLHENVWKEAVKNSKLELKEARCPVMAVNGESLPLCGQVHVTLQVGDYVGAHNVLVVRDMTQQCLLGTDFLEQCHCVINMDNKTLTLAGHPRPVQLCAGECSSTCHVLVQETTVIPAFHQVHLSVHLDANAEEGAFNSGCGLFEPKPEFPDRHGGLLAAHSVSPILSGKNATIQLLNLSAVPVTVYADEKVGKMFPLQDADFVNLVEPSLDRKPVVRSQEAINKSVEQFLCNVHGLTVSEKNQLTDLLYDFSDAISVGDGDLGRTGLLRHKINVGDAPPIRQQARRLPFHQRDMVQKMIHNMLDQGIIEPSESSWASPIVLVKRRDGSFRFCVNFCRLNEATKKDMHPLPRIDDALDSLGGAKWFSTIDLASGYWQVEMNPDDKEKTAFITPFGLHQFRVMPFGLTNAPSTFQRLMSSVLSGLCWTTCLVYLDDIIIFSQTVGEHLQRLADVFRRLKEAGLKVKPSKCQLLRKSVQYLGYIVSEKGVEVDPGKTGSVREWPVPHNHDTLRQFLGFASYYRKFISGFARIAFPLHALMEKSKPWFWSKQCDEAFILLKDKLLSPPILSFPQFDKMFILDMDASQEGLGAVLSQEGERVIAYASRVLTKAERQYCATRREMLGVVWAVRNFRSYLWGRHFIVRTDHNSLQWLRSFKEPQGQVARWLDILAEYDFVIEHRPGERHGNADALSRLPCKQCGFEPSAPPLPSSSIGQRESVCVLSAGDPKQLQQGDPDLEQVISWVRDNAFPPTLPRHGSYWLQTLWSQKSHLLLKEGVLYRRWEDVPGKGQNRHLQLVIPKFSVQSILKEFHDAPTGSHLGQKKTMEKIRSRFYWPGQRHDVENWCRACEKCLSRKSPSQARRAPMQSDLVGYPLQRVAMDILGPLPSTTRGNKYVLVVGDYFTKWVEAYPMINMEAKTVADLFVHQFVSRFGVPDTLHTDQGRNFESSLLKEVCQLLGVSKTRTSPYHPQSDGFVERFNRTLLDLLSIAASENEHDWDLHLPLVMMAYRTSVQESTGCTPFYLMFGREICLPADVMFGLPPASAPQQVNQYALDLRTHLETAYQRVRSHMEMQQRRQKALYDKTAKGHPFKVGDLVWLHCPAVPRGKSPKLHCYWQGPYKVVKPLGDVLYLLQHRDSPRKRTVVHFDRLKPHVAPPQTEEEDTSVEEEDLPQTEEEGTSGEDENDGYFQATVSDEDDVMEEKESREDDDPEPLVIEWETPQQNVAPPQAEPERLRPVRQKKKIDRYGQNIYDT